jgi:hypothetical protein
MLIPPRFDRALQLVMRIVEKRPLEIRSVGHVTLPPEPVPASPRTVGIL